MKTHLTLSVALLAAAIAGPAPAAQLLPAGSDDLVATRLVAMPAPAQPIERKPVAFAWALDPTARVEHGAAFVGDSREWFTQLDAAQLRRGVVIDTTAPGAIVRLSPLGKSSAIATSAIELRRDGRPIAADRAFASRADASALQAAGFDPGAGSVVARIEPALGSGRFEVRAAGAEGRYLLHVFEPDSATVMRSGTTRSAVHAGGRLEVQARLDAGHDAMPGAQFGGQLVSPSGRTVDLRFVATAGGAMRAVVGLPANAAVEPGLWEAQVFAEGRDGERRVQRDGRVAFAVAQPTARLDGNVRIAHSGVAFDLPVQVRSPGRYEVAATLFATAADGIARPVAQAASAAWFEPGARSLHLDFGQDHVPLGYGAPYEVRELTLKDQARMGLLETRGVAVKVAAQRLARDRW
ncbi:MAG: DUF4785 domain-containing protein [Arenimonas sp.]